MYVYFLNDIVDHTNCEFIKPFTDDVLTAIRKSCLQTAVKNIESGTHITAFRACE